MDGLTWQAVGVGVWDGSGEEVGVLEEVTTATPPTPPPPQFFATTVRDAEPNSTAAWPAAVGFPT